MANKNVSASKLSESSLEYLDNMPDDLLQAISFSMPWQHSAANERDEDGFRTTTDDETVDTKEYRDSMQKECFRKVHQNPHFNTSVRGLAGRMTGLGFETLSDVWEIQETIEQIELDPRNRLYYFWPKFIQRYLIEGELFLVLTAHPDGFVEIDFLDPTSICGGGDKNSGIIFHPEKTLMPLFYSVKEKKDDIIQRPDKYRQIPSIFVARYPKTLTLAKKHKDFDEKRQVRSRNRSPKFKNFKGFNQFVIGFDKGFLTRRAVSHLRTVLEWLNYYENLKKYEIDHKKSSGAYVWVFTFDDIRAFKQWLLLTDEEKKKTAIGSKMTPGSKLVLPPGMNATAISPELPSIKDQDTDVLQMVAAGLNEPEDILTGTSRSSYSSVKASRGPMSDRVSDEVAAFRNFLLYDFWSSIFFLKSKVSDYPATFSEKRAVGWKNQEAIFKNVKRRPEQLIDIVFPTSEIDEIDKKARAMLGVKHGPLSQTLGLPNSETAKKLGVYGYGSQRLKRATEEEKYPELVYEGGVDAETVQEKVEGEQPKEKPALVKRKKQQSVVKK